MARNKGLPLTVTLEQSGRTILQENPPMFALIPIVVAFQVQVNVRVGADSAERGRARRNRSEVQAAIEDGGPSRDRPVRRIEVTDEMRRTAFKDAGTRSLLLRARAARLLQDSLLQSYDASTYQRMSVGLGFKAIGRDRLAMRHEDASRVQWQRGVGAVVDVKGSRSVIPIASGEGANDAQAEMNGLSPIPYFPGREQLWIGGGLARAEVDDRDFVHPVAEGAEAYYTYETGDSVIMTLPEGRKITLRELKIQARRAKWNLSVGSFWFEEETAHLVRAVYRISMPMDVWAMEKENRQDTTRMSEADRNRRQRNQDGPPLLVKAMLSPMKVDITAITLEYGLYSERFWLPRNQAFEGIANMSFMRVPVTMEQKFKYESINALEAPLPAINPPTRVTLLRDSLTKAKTPLPVRDSLIRAARRVRAKEIEEAHDRDCATTGSYTTVQRRYGGTVPIMTRVPCDSAKLANSPDLPKSIYDPGDEVFGSAERESLVKSLGYGLQPAWGPQKPLFEYGLSQTRYNRVEGFGTGITATSVLGKGYTGMLGVRASLADKQFNGEFTLSRTNGRSTVRGTVYRRLDVATDWGTPLSFGASLASLLYARDEGAYFRTYGGEIAGTRKFWGNLDWRLFAEEQWKADVSSRWTLFGGGNDSRFIGNPVAQKAREYGASARLRSSVGIDPTDWRLLSDIRVEGAGGDFSYGRAMFDATVSKGFGKLAGAVTASAGYTTGSVPVQRLFYLGGSQTVRGQTALTAAGDAFWLGRAELGTSWAAARPVVFADVGWAGNRLDFGKPGRPLSGVGVGSSFLDGLIRFDIARGLYPRKQLRADVYFEARF